METIKIGTFFTVIYRGMSMTSGNSMIDETWEVVEKLENGYHCELRSSNAVMEVNNNYGQFFSEDTIKESLKLK